MDVIQDCKIPFHDPSLGLNALHKLLFNLNKDGCKVKVDLDIESYAADLDPTDRSSVTFQNVIPHSVAFKSPSVCLRALSCAGRTLTSTPLGSLPSTFLR